MTWSKRFAVLGLALLAGMGGAAGAADDYPSKPIRIIVPVSAGGVTDLVARIAAEYIGHATGQPVIVDNRTGAAGVIGTDAVAKAVPDGYTLGVHATSQIAINPHTIKALPHDPLKDLVPVAPIGEVPQVLVVNPKLPVKTLQEFIAYARERSGKLHYVSLGPGSTVSLAGDRFTRLAKVEMVPVQYRGTTPGITDVMAGTVDMISVGGGPVLSLIQGGQLRALAAGTTKRLPYLPDVPTSAEAGLPGYEMTTWFALFAPAGTPRPILEKLNGLMRAMVAEPAVAKRLTDMYAEPMSMGLDEFAAFVKDDAVRWEQVVREAGQAVR